jgi:hypothetical protein
MMVLLIRITSFGGTVSHPLNMLASSLVDIFLTLTGELDKHKYAWIKKTKQKD